MTNPTIVVLLAVALSSGAFGQRVPSSAESPCARAYDSVVGTMHDMSPTGTRSIRIGVTDAWLLFRMGRRKEATAALDSALALFDRTRTRLTAPADRARVANAVDGLRRCIGSSSPPALARLTVRTFDEDERVADGKGAPAGPGALVRIDGMPVGRTGAGGAFTAPVPSGSVHVTAEVPPSEAGAADVTLSPGSATTVSIVLQSSKEVTEETPLLVAEADGGVLSAAARTLTLTFVGSRGAVKIRKIDEIDLLGAEENSEVSLLPMFRLDAGAIAAIDPAKVIALIRARRSGLVVISVQASDGTAIHASTVEFRIE